MVKESAGDRLFDIINYILLAIVLTIVLYPHLCGRGVYQ